MPVQNVLLRATPITIAPIRDAVVGEAVVKSGPEAEIVGLRGGRLAPAETSDQLAALRQFELPACDAMILGRTTAGRGSRAGKLPSPGVCFHTP